MKSAPLSTMKGGALFLLVRLRPIATDYVSAESKDYRSSGGSIKERLNGERRMKKFTGFRTPLTIPTEGEIRHLPFSVNERPSSCRDSVPRHFANWTHEFRRRNSEVPRVVRL